MSLVSPYGEKLIDIFVRGNKRDELMLEASQLPSITLSDRLLCDFEMIANGGFSPLSQFMGQKDYQGVIDHMRLEDNTLFPVPITFPVSEKYEIGSRVSLRDSYGNVLAVMTIEEQYAWNKEEYAKGLLGSYDVAHPFVPELDKWGKYNIAGKLEAIALPSYGDFSHIRLTPQQVRGRAKSFDNEHVVAFQTRNPLHRAHEELTKKAAEQANATLLIHPVVGLTKPGDIDYITRVRCYEALVEKYYEGYNVILSLLPLAMRMAGPREALWHAIIRRNYGASHFIVGRDHAGPGNNSAGNPFYEPYEAQALVAQYADEIGMIILNFNEMVYVEELGEYKEVNELIEGQTVRSISGTQVREEYLAQSKQLPEWFTRPEVARILMDANVPRVKQGYCIWFTGLSASGKSTIARALESRLNETGRLTTILDGDVIRSHLSKGLGFSREDREENVKRIGYVASQVVKHNGIAICAAISPYEDARNSVRGYFKNDHFIEVYVSTPLEICEARDPKGFYSLARQGKMSGFTGIDDEYQPPQNPELSIDTSVISVDESVEKILGLLENKYGYLTL